jgi:hypothetical protein
MKSYDFSLTQNGRLVDMNEGSFDVYDDETSEVKRI